MGYFHLPLASLLGCCVRRDSQTKILFGVRSNRDELSIMIRNEKSKACCTSFSSDLQGSRVTTKEKGKLLCTQSITFKVRAAYRLRSRLFSTVEATNPAESSSSSYT